GQPIAGGVARLAEEIAVGREQPDLSLCNVRPETPKLVDTPVGRVAGDNGGVDRANGYAGDEIRLDVCLMKGRMDARLISAERAAPLQNQRDAIAARRPPAAERCRRGW